MHDPSQVRVSGPLEVSRPGSRLRLCVWEYRRTPATFQLQLMAHASRWLQREGLGGPAPRTMTLPTHRRDSARTVASPGFGDRRVTPAAWGRARHGRAGVPGLSASSHDLGVRHRPQPLTARLRSRGQWRCCSCACSDFDFG